MEQTVTIILNTIDTEKFRLFQKHYVLFGLLESIGLSEVRNGSITLDFDSEGRIRDIKKLMTYRPPKDKGINPLTETQDGL